MLTSAKKSANPGRSFLLRVTLWPSFNPRLVFLCQDYISDRNKPTDTMWLDKDNVINIFS